MPESRVFRPGSQNLLLLGSEGALACGVDQAPPPVGRSAKPAPSYDAIQLLASACSSRTRSPNAAAVARKNPRACSHAARSSRVPGCTLTTRRKAPSSTKRERSRLANPAADCDATRNVTPDGASATLAALFAGTCRPSWSSTLPTPNRPCTPLVNVCSSIFVWLVVRTTPTATSISRKRVSTPTSRCLGPRPD